MSYGDIIKKIRNGMSYAQFEKVTGIRRSHLHRLIHETSSVNKVKKLEPGIDTLKQICERTGYSFRQFLEEAGYIDKTELQRAFDSLDPTEQAGILESIKQILDNRNPSNSL